MERRQLDQLDTPPVEGGAGGDKEGVGPITYKGCEGRIDLAVCTGVDDLDLQPLGASSGLDVSNRGLGSSALARLMSIATRVAVGTSSRRSSSRFAANSPAKKLIPVRLPPGRARLATRPNLTGSSAAIKTMGIILVAALASSADGTPPHRSNRGDLPANQFGHQSVADAFDFRPSDIRWLHSRPRHNHSPSVPGEMRAVRLRNTSGDWVGGSRSSASRAAAHAPRRPCGRRTADKRYELAPLHCVMPSVLSTERYHASVTARGLLHCGISIQPMSQLGHSRPSELWLNGRRCPLLLR